MKVFCILSPLPAKLFLQMPLTI